VTLQPAHLLPSEWSGCGGNGEKVEIHAEAGFHEMARHDHEPQVRPKEGARKSQGKTFYTRWSRELGISVGEKLLARCKKG